MPSYDTRRTHETVTGNSFMTWESAVCLLGIPPSAVHPLHHKRRKEKAHLTLCTLAEPHMHFCTAPF